MPERIPRTVGIEAIHALRRARRPAITLAHWHIVDELAIAELIELEDTIRGLQGDLQAAVQVLFQAQRKRAAQSSGSELRHQVGALKKDLEDCQAAKLALGGEGG